MLEQIHHLLNPSVVKPSKSPALLWLEVIPSCFFVSFRTFNLLLLSVEDNVGCNLLADHWIENLRLLSYWWAKWQKDDIIGANHGRRKGSGEICQYVDLLYLNEWCFKVTGWIKETCVSTNTCKWAVVHTRLSLSRHQHGAVTSQYHKNEAIRAAKHSCLPSSGPIRGSRRLTKEPNTATLSQTSSSIHPSIFFVIESSITLMTPRSHKH